MTSGAWHYSFPGSLTRAGCRQLGGLLSGMSGTETQPGVTPFIAPLMAFGSAGGGALDGALMSGAKVRPGLILIHESLALEARKRLAAEEAFTMDANVHESGVQSDSLSITAELSTAADIPAVNLTARLRWIGVDTLVGLKPLALARATRNGELRRFETRPVKQGDVTQYVTLAGDTNPLHVDRQCALQAGLETTVIPGALLAGLLEPALAAMEIGRQIVAMRVRFVAPHPVGESIGFAISAETVQNLDPKADLRVFIYRRADGVTGVADLTLI